jgi:hypothetical protein
VPIWLGLGLGLGLGEKLAHQEVVYIDKLPRQLIEGFQEIQAEQTQGLF